MADSIRLNEADQRVQDQHDAHHPGLTCKYCPKVLEARKELWDLFEEELSLNTKPSLKHGLPYGWWKLKNILPVLSALLFFSVFAFTGAVILYSWFFGEPPPVLLELTQSLNIHLKEIK